MEGASDAWASTVTAASPWAVDAALLIVSLSLALAVLGGLGSAVAMRFRDMLGAGATPKQVRGLLDEKINGGLERIEKKLDALDAKVDAHGERLVALETLELMASGHLPRRRQ